MDPKTPMPIPGTYGGTEAWGTSVSVFWPQGKADSNWMADALVRSGPFLPLQSHWIAASGIALRNKSLAPWPPAFPDTCTSQSQRCPGWALPTTVFLGLSCTPGAVEYCLSNRVRGMRKLPSDPASHREAVFLWFVP